MVSGDTRLSPFPEPSQAACIVAPWPCGTFSRRTHLAKHVQALPDARPTPGAASPPSSSRFVSTAGPASQTPLLPGVHPLGTSFPLLLAERPHAGGAPLAVDLHGRLTLP